MTEIVGSDEYGGSMSPLANRVAAMCPQISPRTHPFPLWPSPSAARRAPVDRPGPGIEIGGHSSESTSPGPSASPRSPDEVGDLAFDDGVVGPVALGPTRLLLFGPGSLQRGLVGVDADGAARA